MEEKKKRFGELEENIMLIPLLISFVLTMAGFFIKLFGNSELASKVVTCSYYAYAWVCCLSLGCCVRDNRYLRLALLEKKYPAPIRKFWSIFNDLLGFVLMSVMLVGTFFVIRNYLGGDEVSKLVVFTYFAPIVGFGIGIIRMIQNKIKGGKER